MAISPGGLG